MITGDALGRLLKNVGLATRMAGFSIGKAHEPRVLRFSFDGYFDCLTSCSGRSIAKCQAPVLSERVIERS